MFKELLGSKWFTVAALATVGFFLISIIGFAPQLATVGGELKNLNQKILEAQKNNSELENMADYLKSDAYLERQARLQLNYKKPGEKVVYAYPNPNAKVENKGVRTRQKSNFFSKMAGWLQGFVDKVILRD